MKLWVKYKLTKKEKENTERVKNKTQVGNMGQLNSGQKITGGGDYNLLGLRLV